MKRKRRPQGFDAGKKINGRKRHIVTDTSRLLVGLVVHSATIQGRDGAAQVLQFIVKRWPWQRHVFADGGCAGPKLKAALKRIGRLTLEIVKRTDKAKGFEMLPRRWVGKRTFAWPRRCRRLVRDFEKSIGSAEAWIHVASNQLDHAIRGFFRAAIASYFSLLNLEPTNI